MRKRTGGKGSPPADQGETMDYRYLHESDREQLEDLIGLVESKLPDSTWWPPIKPEVSEHFFDKNWIRFIGCFDGERLIAAAGLFLEPSTFASSAEAAGLDPASVAEIGRCMVRPSKRGSNLMIGMSKQLTDYARAVGREWIIAAVHPDNTAGCRSLEQLGMTEKGHVVQDGTYPRTIYAIEI